jgi:hypothetical protein
MCWRRGQPGSETGTEQAPRGDLPARDVLSLPKSEAFCVGAGPEGGVVLSIVGTRAKVLSWW